MKLFLFLLLILSAKISFAQTVVRIITLDQKYKDPIWQVLVHLESNDYSDKKYTTKSGEVFFTIKTKDSVSFRFEHVVYQAVKLPAKRIYRSNASDTISFSVRMIVVKDRELDEIEVKPIGKPDTVYGSKRLSVSDFEFLSNGQMALLTYPKNLKKGTELLLFDNEDVIGEISLEENGVELIRDFRGNPHVVTENSVYGLTTLNDQIQVGKIDKPYFFKYIAPIVDTSISKYFFTTFNPDYPAFEYYTYDLIDCSYQKIAKITDDLMMELYRSEYKWVDIRTKLWARTKERETGIDKEIWVGANYFTQSIYYKELYAPLFLKNDTLFVFDHYKNWLYRYSSSGELMDSIAIYHHIQPKETGWKENIIQDQLTGELYMYYEKDGKVSLRLFNTSNGSVGNQISLTFKYADKVLVRQNFVYYIYRPFESVSKKYLYRERLPFDFKTNEQRINEIKISNN